MVFISYSSKDYDDVCLIRKVFCKKFKEDGIENTLFDAPGRGRNAEIIDEEKAWIINIVC